MAQTPEAVLAHSPESWSGSKSLDGTPSIDDGISSLGPSRLRLTSLSSTSSFQEDIVCKVCEAALGKRKLNPRHHCRICGSSVCAKCSPSQVQVDGEKALVRACTPCVSNVEKAAPFKDRLSRLAGVLNALGDSKTSEEAPPTLEDAIGRCEEMVPALEDQSESHATKTTQLAGARLQLEEVTTRAERTETQLDQLQEAHQSLTSVLKEERDSHAAVKAELDETRLKHEAAENRAGMADAQVDTLQQTLQHLELTFEEERYSHAAVKAELDDTRLKHEAAENRAGMADAQVDTLQQTLQHLESTFEEEDAALDEMNLKHEAAENRACMAEVQVDTLRQALQQLESTLKEEQGNHAAAQSDLACMTVRHESSEALIGKMQTEMEESKLKDDTAKTRADLSEIQVEALQQTLKRAESTMKDEQDGYVVAQSELVCMSAKHEAAEALVEKVQTQLQDERTNHADAKLELADLRRKQEVEDKAKCHMADDDGELNELKARVASIEKEFENEKQLRESAEQKLQSLERNLTHARSDTSSLPRATSDFRTAIADHMRRNDEPVRPQKCSERGGCVST